MVEASVHRSSLPLIIGCRAGIDIGLGQVSNDLYDFDAGEGGLYDKSTDGGACG
jgi:hypothetical protein